MKIVTRIALSFLLVASFSAAAHAAEPEVTVDSGLSPHLKPAAVAEIARGYLAKPIEGVDTDVATGRARVIPTQPDVEKLHCTTYDKIIQIRDPAGNLNRSVVWMIEGQGTFVSHRGAPGSPSTVHDRGFLVIDDASGAILGEGSSTSPRGAPPSEPPPQQP